MPVIKENVARLNALNLAATVRIIAPYFSTNVIALSGNWTGSATVVVQPYGAAAQSFTADATIPVASGVSSVEVSLAFGASDTDINVALSYDTAGA